MIFRVAMEKQMENRPMDKVGGEEGEGEMYGNSYIATYNNICKIYSRWEFAVCFRELKEGLYHTACEGWDVERDERVVWEGGDMGVWKRNSKK